MKSLKKIKGFTLVELIVVIVIIGILAAVAVPAYQGYVTKSRNKTLTATNTLLTNAVSSYRAENATLPTDAQVCCGADSIMVSQFTFTPINPFCAGTTATTYGNEPLSAFVGSADEPVIKDLGWTYDPTTGLVGPDYNSADCTAPN